MRVTVLVLASSVALAFATTAFADTEMSAVTPQPTAMAQPISATSADDSKTVICHHLVHEGVLMPHQVCLTKHSWEMMRLQTQRTVSDFELHSFVVPMK
jgi:hypothetical protein